MYYQEATYLLFPATTAALQRSHGEIAIKTRWEKKDIDAAKAYIRTQIIEYEQEHGKKKTVDFLKAQIHRYGEESDARSQQYLLLTIINALAFNDRNGGFKEQEAKTLVQIAYGVLQANGIATFTSKFAYLYGDIHRIRSNTLFRAGDFWRSSWDLQIAVEVSGTSEALGSIKHTFDLISMGTRSMRLGHCAAAARYFESAESHGCTDEFFEIARSQRITSLRLQGHFEAAKALIEETKADARSRAKLLLDAAWESKCHLASQAGDLSEIVKATRRGEAHYTVPFIMEAYLWMLAMAGERWKDQFPKIASLPRRQGLSHDKSDLTFQVVSVIEDCQDASIPILSRLSQIETILDDLHRLDRIEIQLLCFVAICRWLANQSCFHLANLLLNEYMGTSLKISGGKSRDVLRIAGDLLLAPWYIRDSEA